MNHKRPQPAGASDVAPLSIERLVGEHHASVYRYAYRLCGAAAEAEDVTQQTFLNAHEKIHQIRDAARARGWLLRVARNCFLKGRRRRRPQAAMDVDLDVNQLPDGLQIDPADDAPIDSEKLQRALDELPDEFRMVVVLFYFEGLSYKQIAAEMQWPLGTVMSRLSRAKRRLRQHLAPTQSKRTQSKRTSPAPDTAPEPAERST